MITDLRALESGQSLEADVCIIGGGAAGITIARELIGQRTTAVVLESGGLELEPETQALCNFENVGLPYRPGSRVRVFGGTTSIWDGRTAPLTDNDLGRRDWVERSGWPIGRATLLPYYARATRVLGLAIDQNRADLPSLLETPLPALDSSKLSHQFWEFKPGQPVRFGWDYRRDIEAAANVRVVLHANATNIQVAPNGGRVDWVDVSTLEHKRSVVRARQYVLAAGGIENARLLLVSDGVEHQGVGNRRDLVGRFFMEHARTDAAEIVAYDDYRFRTTYSSSWLRQSGDAHFLTGIALSPAIQARRQLLDCGAIFYYDDDEDSSTRALQRLVSRQYAQGSSVGIRHDVWAVMRDLQQVIVDARQRLLLPSKEAYSSPKRITMKVDTEQAPMPQSRVMLSDGRERDALGLRRTKLDWRLTDLERRTLLTFARTVGEEFGRLGIGRLRIAEWLVDERPSFSVYGGHHHMGTTRMASDAASGVVSPDCQVFGIDNLYVAGSSVFPTSGFVNPTLTIVALALRLVDHIKAAL